MSRSSDKAINRFRLKHKPQRAARRAIQNGALKSNDIQITDDRFVFNNIIKGKRDSIKFSMGKKKHVLIKPKQA